MQTYKVTAIVTKSEVCLIDAESEEEAQQIAETQDKRNWQYDETLDFEIESVEPL